MRIFDGKDGKISISETNQMSGFRVPIERGGEIKTRQIYAKWQQAEDMVFPAESGAGDEITLLLSAT